MELITIRIIPVGRNNLIHKKRIKGKSILSQSNFSFFFLHFLEFLRLYQWKEGSGGVGRKQR